MRYLALATDYDGTLAAEGKVAGSTCSALKRLADTGRRLVLVTGRQLEDLLEVFPEVGLFEWVVAENGALLYDPRTRQEKPLGEPPPKPFVDALIRRGVQHSQGRVILATWEPNEAEVLETIKDLGLELQVIFNKGAVMVLPHGVNKATGLSAALERMGLSPHNVVGVGDAENDHAFLSACECAVAVGNALPMLKDAADLVTEGNRGKGVEELIERLIRSDLSEIEPKLVRHHILLGRRIEGKEEVYLPPLRTNLLVAGSSGAGKSTIAVGLLERLAEKGYQYCLIDPEGDYASLPESVELGDQNNVPSTDEVLQLLENPGQSVVVGLGGLRLPERPGFFNGLLVKLLELRAACGRPHWLLVDEAHHLMPASWDAAPLVLPQEISGLAMITVHPEHVSKAAVALVNTALAVGVDPVSTLQGYARSAGLEAPGDGEMELEEGEVLTWFSRQSGSFFRVRTEPGKAEHNRHHRKYAEGELGKDKSFYFRGPEEKLNLRAVNLTRFVELAEGIDDDTWMHHLRAGDYSRWFRDAIKDEELAGEVAAIEADMALDAAGSRDMVTGAVEERYTAAE